MDESCQQFRVLFPAGAHAVAVVQPADRPFHEPAAAVRPQRAAVLWEWLGAVLSRSGQISSMPA